MYRVDSDENMILSKDASCMEVGYNGERISSALASRKVFYTLSIEGECDQCGQATVVSVGVRVDDKVRDMLPFSYNHDNIFILSSVEDTGHGKL